MYIRTDHPSKWSIISSPSLRHGRFIFTRGLVGRSVSVSLVGGQAGLDGTGDQLSLKAL